MATGTETMRTTPGGTGMITTRTTTGTAISNFNKGNGENRKRNR
jgi:hypothetical protein